MRLIDADALKEELKERGLLSAVHSLDNAPTVDADDFLYCPCCKQRIIDLEEEEL